MTIKQLIEQLSQFDPNTEVLGTCTDPTDYTYKVKIESIELGSPYDDNGYSGVDGSLSDSADGYNDDGDYVGTKVLLINIGDV
jgi:hypothetical protein